MLSTTRLATGCMKHWGTTPGQICKFLGFCWGSIGVTVILARDAASLGDWCPTFRNIIVASSSRIERKWHYHAVSKRRAQTTYYCSATKPEGRIPDTRISFFATMFTPTSSSLLLTNINSSHSGGKTAEEWSCLYTPQSRHIKRGALIPQFEAISLLRHKKNLPLVHTRETGWKIFSMTRPQKRKTTGARSRGIRPSRTIHFQGYHAISKILKRSNAVRNVQDQSKDPIYFSWLKTYFWREVNGPCHRH